MRVFSDIVYVSISLSNVGVIFRINFASQISPIQLDTVKITIRPS